MVYQAGWRSIASALPLPQPPASASWGNIPYDPASGYAQDTPLLDAAQDSTGKIWGVMGSGALVSWNGVGWTYEAPPKGIVGSAFRLAKAPSGAVICAWVEGDAKTLALSAERASFGRVLGTVTLTERTNRTDDIYPTSGLSCLYADQNSAWIVTAAGAFYRADLATGSTGKIANVYRIATTDYLPGYQKQPNGDPAYFVAWDAATDGGGHTWFYTCSVRGSDNFAALRGVLLWNGHTMVRVPAIPSLPGDKPIDNICYRDDGHVWVSAHNGGLYTVDVKNMTAIREPDIPDYFERTYETVLNVAGQSLVVTGFGTAFPEKVFPTGTGGTLWRYAAQTWTPIIRGIDKPNPFRLSNHRALAITNAGAWIASDGNNVWLLPANGGSPKHLDWTCNFPLPVVDRIFHTSDTLGGVIAVALQNSTHNKWGLVTHLERYATAHPAKAVTTFSVNVPLAEDSHGHLWGIFVSAPPGPQSAANPAADLSKSMLQEWDGRIWTPHPLPGTFNMAGFQALSIDTKGHVWVVMSKGWAMRQNTVFVYVPERDTFDIFRDYEAAFVTAAQQAMTDFKNDPAPGKFGLSEMSGGITPNFSTDGQCGYKDEENSGIHIYDGKAWHVFKRPEVTGEPNTFAFDGPPFFDNDNTPCVNGNIFNNVHREPKDYVTWRWANHATWQSGPYLASDTDFNVSSAKKSTITAPPNCPPSDGVWYTIDRSGDYWFVSKGVPYRYHAGKAAPVIPNGLANPFVDGRRLSAALIDPAGNVFLESAGNNNYEYVIVPKP
jgi:hypothetical protein